MRIQNNIMALNTHRQYNIANNSTAGSAEKLSSGYKINRAGDDAAGLAISEKMRAQIRGLNMASKNSLDAVSLIQTAEGALQSTHDILQRMRELAVQSASDGNEQVIDRGALNQEFQALKKEIDDTAAKTRFNDQNLIDGTFQKAMYSVNIASSNLAYGVTANVSRVGVKSDHNAAGKNDIDVNFVVEQAVIEATKGQVDVSGLANTIFSSVEFDPKAGAAHNGKTWDLSVVGDGLTVGDFETFKISDNDTDVNAKISASNGLEAGSKITISFGDVGTLTLVLAEKLDTINPISEALNDMSFKFSSGGKAVVANALDTTDVANVVASTGTAAGYKDFAFTPGSGLAEKFANATSVEFKHTWTTGLAADFAASKFTFEVTLADGTTETITATGAEMIGDVIGGNGSGVDAKTASVSISFGDLGKMSFTLTSTTHATPTTAAAVAAVVDDIATAIGTTKIALGAAEDIPVGTDRVVKVNPAIAMTLNGETHVLKQNDKTIAFDSTGVSMKFNALDLSGVQAAYNAEIATALATWEAANPTLDPATFVPAAADVETALEAANTAALALFTGQAYGAVTADKAIISVHVSEAEGKALTIQTGANQGDEMQINIDAMNLRMLGLTDSNIATQKSASRAITEVNNAINQVSTQRAALGALQNRLNFKIANLDTSAENLQAAESRIRDVDMAAEMTKFTKSNILVQAATAMLAQANSQPQNVLQLLR